MGVRLRSALLLWALVAGAAVPAPDRVPFKDVTALTFRAGAWTTGHRVSPIPQARCRGRMCARFAPAVIHCQRTGWDGRDATWRCEADHLARDLRFGEIRISCEGYSSPQDPFILAGSCGLTYQLVEAGAKSDGGSDDDNESWGLALFALLLAVLFAFVMITSCCAGRRWQFWPGGDDDGSPPPSYDGYHRMPSFDRPMPSASCRPASSSSSGPGFWSGLGVGALAGYAFGHRHRSSHATAVPADRWGWRRSRSPPPTSSSAETRTAFGYATTERR